MRMRLFCLTTAVLWSLGCSKMTAAAGGGLSSLSSLGSGGAAAGGSLPIGSTPNTPAAGGSAGNAGGTGNTGGGGSTGSAGDSGSTGGTGGTGNSGSTVPAAPSLVITAPANNQMVSGTLTVNGTANSVVQNVSAYDQGANYAQVAGNSTPANGAFSLTIDTTQLANGPHVIAVIAFTVAAGQQNGVSKEFDVTINVQNQLVQTNGNRPAPIAAAAFNAYQLTFEDKFTTNTISLGDTWDGSKWYNGTEQCCMIDSTGLPAVMFPTAVNGVSINPYSLITGGGLNIDLIKQNNVWYSGVLTSTDRNHKGFTQQYGYFEAIAKVPSGDGVWPAFWLLSTDPNMPGEIDIMEYYGHDQGKTFGITLHDWRNGGNNSNIPNNSFFPKVSGMMDDYHAYGMLWTATEMKFYYDAQLVWTKPTPDVMKQSYYFLVNMGMGAGWPTDKTPGKQTFQVKSIRAYQAP